MITLLVGTNRPGSTTRKVAAEIEEVYWGLDMPLRVVELANLPPQIFAPKACVEKPNSFRVFSNAIPGADGLVGVTLRSKPVPSHL